MRAALLAVALMFAVAPARAQIAVIVNKENPIGDLALADLERLYLGRQTTFANGAAVALGEYQPARHAFYRTVLRMNETAVSRHWIGIVFSEQNATPPREFRNWEDVRRFVMTTRGAICFIDWASVNDSVKVLTIGGRGPKDARYFVR